MESTTDTINDLVRARNELAKRLDELVRETYELRRELENAYANVKTLTDALSNTKMPAGAADGNNQLWKWVVELVAAKKELSAERDEARREVCAWNADCADAEREYAKLMGWDCFKENT